MGKGRTTIKQAAALALLLSGGVFMPAQAHCPHTEPHDSGSPSGGPTNPAPHHCNAAAPPPPVSSLATAQGWPQPPVPPPLPVAQELGELRQGPNPAPGPPGEDGALGRQSATTDLAIALGSLPAPSDPGWAVSTSVTSVGSVAVGLAHVVEDEDLSVSLGVGTDWSHAQGVAVLNLNL